MFTVDEFTKRWWAFRPTGRGIIAMTGATLAIMWFGGWPAWAAGLLVVAITAAMAAGFAALELWNEAAAPPEPDDQEGEAEPEAPAGAAFAVDTEPEEGRHVSLKPKADGS